MKIGELAQATGVTVDTLRFWEKQGLLEAKRGENSYRYYDDSSVNTLHFILSMKSLGFSLEDIRELLDIRVDIDSHTCGEVKAVVDAHLEQVQTRLVELQRIQSALFSLSNACCGGPEGATHCSILDALDSQLPVPSR
ncbi:Zn(2+)-responsive transcriptional regulator [Gallaecimonas mangrovi]|uniref:Zn(2+)-responsive transcriptional regulator n=1 Tax=Gallaecimonas mangrovi TaxID=2291597 RepID=UPI000E2079BD|nr:Zn(2+)-responsive transcriptional regulator [Gallaecimonas mangrovi]